MVHSTLIAYYTGFPTIKLYRARDGRLRTEDGAGRYFYHDIEGDTSAVAINAFADHCWRVGSHLFDDDDVHLIPEER